ncbi:MAG: cytochrome c oxidase subunit 3 [Acidobacteriaceae bacterium]
MSATTCPPLPPQAPPPLVSEGQPHTGDWPIETNRGVYAVWSVIATEGTLFICLFASYYFLGNNKNRWAIDHPPKLMLAFVMLAILMSSSLVIMWGERMVKQARFGLARAAVCATIFMGLIFLGVQAFEYKDHWKTLTPQTDSYGSIFYTITTFHAAHVIVGLLLLSYLAILPNYGPTTLSPHRAYRVVSLYWHFVDIIWLFVVLLLYVIPHFQFYGF